MTNTWWYNPLCRNMTNAAALQQKNNTRNIYLFVQSVCYLFYIWRINIQWFQSQTKEINCIVTQRHMVLLWHKLNSFTLCWLLTQSSPATIIWSYLIVSKFNNSQNSYSLIDSSSCSTHSIHIKLAGPDLFDDRVCNDNRIVQQQLMPLQPLLVFVCYNAIPYTFKSNKCNVCVHIL